MAGFFEKRKLAAEEQRAEFNKGLEAPLGEEYDNPSRRFSNVTVESHYVIRPKEKEGRLRRFFRTLFRRPSAFEKLHSSLKKLENSEAVALDDQGLIVHTDKPEVLVELKEDGIHVSVRNVANMGALARKKGVPVSHSHEMMNRPEALRNARANQELARVHHQFLETDGKVQIAIKRAVEKFLDEKAEVAASRRARFWDFGKAAPGFK